MQSATKGSIKDGPDPSFLLPYPDNVSQEGDSSCTDRCHMPMTRRLVTAALSLGIKSSVQLKTVPEDSPPTGTATSRPLSATCDLRPNGVGPRWLQSTAFSAALILCGSLPPVPR